MKKNEYIKEVADKTSLSLAQVEKVMNAMIRVTQSELNTSRESRLPGFGTFKMVDVPERQCRNPKTGEAMIVAAKIKTRFKVTKGF
jgi:DNA-binding protein HU-beta